MPPAKLRGLGHGGQFWFHTIIQSNVYCALALCCETTITARQNKSSGFGFGLKINERIGLMVDRLLSASLLGVIFLVHTLLLPSMNRDTYNRKVL